VNAQEPTLPPVNPCDYPQDYPASPLEGVVTDIADQICGNGTHTVSASSQKTETAVNAFDGDGYTCWFTSDAYQSSVFPNSYTGSVVTTVSATQLRGEWIQIDMPTRIKPTSYTISSCVAKQSNSLDLLSWVLLGSNGEHWSLIHRIDEDATWNEMINIPLDPSSQSWKSFRLVVLESQSSDSEELAEISLGDLKIEGILGSSCQFIKRR
jgi:hypothetical protein